MIELAIQKFYARFKKQFLASCLVVIGFLFLSSFTYTLTAQDPDVSEKVASDLLPFVKQHCSRCHGGDQPKGDLVLPPSPTKFTEKDLENWERVLEALESDEMPPKDEDQPDAKAKQKIIALISNLLRTEMSGNSSSTRAAMARRMTNFEYQNTMRDLLGLDLNYLDSLSKDPVKPYRFNNTAEFMRLGPEQVNRYLECARRAMASVIVNPERPEVHKTRREWKSYGVDRGLGADEVGVWGNRRNTPASGMGLKSFPKSGEYRIRIKAAAILPTGVSELPLRLVMGYGLGENSSTLRVEPVGTIRLSNSPDEMKVYEFRGRIENHPARPGRVVKGKRRPDTMVITPQNLYDDGTLNDGQRQLAMPRAIVHWMEFEAPVVDVWPPEHHTRILFDSPLRKTDTESYVRQALEQFMSRAYRRPATNVEVERYLQVYKLVSAELDTFEDAIRETLAMVLISPQFLYHTPIKTETASPAKIEKVDAQIDQFALASRLSYFLWGSMPDEKLFGLAAQKKLANKAEIEKQVLRMLADSRSSQFVRNFSRQWLSLGKMKTVPINRELFPRFLYYVPRGERAGTEQPYRPTIRDYMIDETVGFIGELIRSNASVKNIVDSQFAFLNQPLAAHYGVQGVEGNHFRKVPIQPSDHLGGLLTHGSVLIGNGTGTAPHPIYRAVWLREAILGDDVPAPPADVPALSDSAGDSAETALSIKALLQKHRQKTSCNSCHAKLDPWGIPFEHYNAIGRFSPRVPKEGTRVSSFRVDQHGDLAGYQAYLDSINVNSVDARTKLPNGPDVDGMDDLKQFLISHRLDDIGENMVRRFLEYGTGRRLTFRDRAEVKRMQARLKLSGYRLKDIIVRVCQSDIFCEQTFEQVITRKPR